MDYWLFKSEPGSFSIEDLHNRPGMTEPWDGVRNYPAPPAPARSPPTHWRGWPTAG